MTNFLLKSTLSLVLLYGVYVVLLEREKMHHFNRFFLLFSLVFSLVIPFISFEIYVETTQTIQHNTVQALPFSALKTAEKTNYLPLFLWSMYGLVTSILTIRFMVNLKNVQQKTKRSPKQSFHNSTLVLLEENVLPHTFLHYIFINKSEFEKSEIEDELYTHELTHVRQKHTLDILFIEILKTIFWFNPILIFYKKAMQLNHEFLADEKVVKSYNNVPFYQNLLLEKATWSNNFYLASNLNFLVTKKRLIMMTKTTSSETILFKKMSIFPVFTILIYFLCFETVAQQKNQSPKTDSETTTISDDKMLDEYFAGVRFKLYKNGFNTKTELIGKDLIFDKTYEELTPEDKVTFKTWLKIPKATVKKSPTQTELEEFTDDKKYAIWIDNKNVPNSELNKYEPKEIAYFSGSVILKNARTKQHPQPFQYWFYTHSYFDKNEMGKQSTKYGGDKVEIFQNFDKKLTTERVAELSSTKEKEVLNNSSENDIYTSVEKRPEFPGGIQAFYDFVGKNYKMPEVKDLKGRIFVKFIIEADGSLSEIESIRDIGHGTGDEAVRVLKLSPKWIAAEQDGKKVRVQYSLPISISGN